MTVLLLLTLLTSEHFQSLIRAPHLHIMKRAAEYTGVDNNGAPLKKHDDDPDARIARNMARNSTGHHYTSLRAQ
jgi:hypothetical protein